MRMVSDGGMRSLFALVTVLAACDHAQPQQPPLPDAPPDLSVLGMTPEMVDETAELTLTRDTMLTVKNASTTVATPIVFAVEGTTEFAVVGTTCGVLQPFETCEIQLRFAPTTLGVQQGQLRVSAASGGEVISRLKGTGQLLSEIHSTLLEATDELGYAAVGHSGTRTITYRLSTTRTTPTAPLAMSFVQSYGFVTRSNGCVGQTLVAGTTCDIVIGFDPLFAGQRNTALHVIADPGGELYLPVQGIGIATDNVVEITPNQQVFPDTTVGQTSATLTATVTNTGGVATNTLTTKMTLLDAAEFTIVTDTCNGVALAGHASCTLALQFHPSSAGFKFTYWELMGTSHPNGTGTMVGGSGI